MSNPNRCSNDFVNLKYTEEYMILIKCKKLLILSINSAFLKFLYFLYFKNSIKIILAKEIYETDRKNDRNKAYLIKQTGNDSRIQYRILLNH